jgi:putative ABC transport system permease protein
MRSLVWRLIELRLRRVVPPAYLASTIGDLEEDYARRRATNRSIPSWLWLFREVRSLVQAYRAATAAARAQRPGRARLMLRDDVRHAWRRVAARPLAAVLAAALLSLGIGLSTAMFSVADSLLLQPAPFRNPDRLVQQGLLQNEPAVMHGWRSTGMFEAVEAASAAMFQTGDAGGDRWAGAFVTPGLFGMLGVRPVRGRVFDAVDGRPLALDEVVLSEALWRSGFGGDRELLGRRIHLDGASVTVVGIMPAGFRFPTPATIAWRPLDLTSAQRGTAIVGRLAPGVPRAAAEGPTTVIARQLARLPRNYRGAPPLLPVGGAELSGFTRRAVWLLLAGVALVFMVLCANVSSLLLTNLSARRREFGICGALGASRGRLMRQAAAEHTLIAVSGAAAGVGLAWGLTSLVPDFFLGRTLNPIDIDLRALLAASGLGAASVLLSGLVPAWLGTRPDPADALRRSRQAGTESRPTRIFTRGLLVAEIAFACSLLVGSGLLVRSFVMLVDADRGLTLDHVVRVNLGGLDRAFPSIAAMSLGTSEIEARVSAWPEIAAVALSREIPPSWSANEVSAEGDPGAVPGSNLRVRSDRYRVNAAFFEMYGIPILRGRPFQSGDTDQDVIVGERLAALLWPGLDPVGRTLDIGPTASRVIGVAGEIRLPTLDHGRDRPEYYVPLGNASRTLYLNYRCRAACPDEGTIRDRLAEIHPAIVARLERPSENEYLNQLRLPRAIAEVGGVFAVVSVLTAAGGLFSLMTYAVARRRHEFGIRTALGASPRQIRRLVLRDGTAVVAIGIAAGLLGGWLVARSLAAFHDGITSADPVTWTAVIGLIALTSLAAAWRPARQAMRVDPVKLLREE